jgi:hypothetical protein
MLVVATVLHFSVALLLNTLFFCMMLVFSFSGREKSP